MDRLKKAHDFASIAHNGQERKFSKEPYLKHLETTAQFVWEATNGKADMDDYIAAILHDVVEDTDVSLEEIGREFGKIVMNLVEELTIDPAEKLAEGKKHYLKRKLNTMSSKALTIKLGDRLSNICSLEDEVTPIGFIKWYVNETIYLIDNLNRELNEEQKYLLDKIKQMLLFLKINKNF